MYLAYVDDSGGELSFTLGCLLIKADAWPDTFDNVIEFRRFLKKTYGLPVRAEVKANYLLYGKKAAHGMHEKTRHSIYRGLMELQGKIGAKTFGVVIRKAELAARGKEEAPLAVAWEYLIQRIERTTSEEGVPALILHDEGDSDRIRTLVRKARRAGTAGSMFGTGSLSRPARLVLDDPVPKNSEQSYFVQLADLAAFAAFRKMYPLAKASVVCPNDMWDRLGGACYGKVNERKGERPPGIVCWP